MTKKDIITTEGPATNILGMDVADIAPTEHKAELAGVDSVAVLPITPEMVAAVESVATLHRQLRLAALRITSPSDWLSLEGTPYLSVSGCHRLARLFRVRQRNAREEYVPVEGATVVVVRAEASSEVLDRDGWVEVLGTARTDDPFLTRRGAVKADWGAVLKKARANWLGNAVRQLLGLHGFTWEDLEAYGIHRSQVRQVVIPKRTKVVIEAAAEAVAARESEPGTTSQEQGDTAQVQGLVWVKVHYPKLQEFKRVISALGMKAQWDGEHKRWGIPRIALQYQDVVDCLEGEGGQDEHR